MDWEVGAFGLDGVGVTFSGGAGSILRTGFWGGKGILDIWRSHPPTLIAARHSFYDLSFVTLTSCSTSELEQNPCRSFACSKQKYI
jgi:hypothetical protein